MEDLTNANIDPMPELNAMTEIAKALQSLDDSAIKRVLGWATARFLNPVNQQTILKGENSVQNNISGILNNNEEDFEEISDLFETTSPQNDPEKALLVAYWVQKIKGQGDFEAATINSELKHLGHGISNITSALNSLISRKPNLVIQTRKSGSSQQARKKYKLTNEGMKYIQRMIRGED